jgi:hypothetical protein
MHGCSVSSGSILLLTASTNVAYHWVGLAASFHLFFLFPYLTYHLFIDGFFLLHFCHVSRSCLESTSRVGKAAVCGPAAVPGSNHQPNGGIPANTDPRIPTISPFHKHKPS